VVIDYFPAWMAPNLITLIGFCFPLVSYVLMTLHCPDFTGEAPTWLYAYNVAGLLLYMMLDSIDGKQARRTVRSLPAKQSY